MLQVAPVVRNKAIVLGAGDWLEAVPELLADVLTEWSLTVGQTFESATEALVVEATLEDGSPAVLKLPIPGCADAVRHEVTALRLADGNGCGRLLGWDEPRHVLLLERLGRSLHELAMPLQARHEILCATAQRVWCPATGCSLPTGADKGRWLADWISAAWEETDQPCSRCAVEHALTCAERRVAAHDDERDVLVHGDVHERNVSKQPATSSSSIPMGCWPKPNTTSGS